MEEIDMSMGGLRVTFKPSDRDLPPSHNGWTLYEVYVEDEYAGLVTNTGLESKYEPKERIWKPLEGNAYQMSQFLNRDEAAAAFVHWYYDQDKSNS